MFERFTDGSRRVMVFTQDEAHRLGHNFIAPDHVLLGLLRNDVDVDVESPGRGRRRGRRAPDGRGSLFKALNIDREALRPEVEESADRVHRMVQKLGGGGFPEDLHRRGPFTESTKTALELSLREALSLGHNAIAPCHILLGLLRKGEPESLLSKIDYETGKRGVSEWLTSGTSGQAPWPPAYQRWGASATPSRGFRHVAEVAVANAERERELPGSQHLLLAMASAEGTLAQRVLQEIGIAEGDLRDRIARLGTSGTLDDPPRARVAVRVKGREIDIDEDVLEKALRAAAESDPELAEAISGALDENQELDEPETGN